MHPGMHSAMHPAKHPAKHLAMRPQPCAHLPLRLPSLQACVKRVCESKLADMAKQFADEKKYESALPYYNECALKSSH